MFNAEMGGQVAWLLPAALLLMVAALVVVGRAARTDRTRAAVLLWGGWLLVTGLVFSFMQGIFHAYYTVALAPAIGALVGIGAVVLWRRRALPAAGAALALTVAVTAAWAFVLLHRSSGFVPWLAPLVLVVGLAAALALAFVTAAAGPRGRGGRRSGRADLAGRPHGVRAADREPAAHRVDPDGGPGGGRAARGGPGGARAAFGPGGPTGAAPQGLTRDAAQSAPAAAPRRPGRRHGRAAVGQLGQRRDAGTAGGGRLVVHLGGGGGGVEQRVGLPAGHRPAGDADRRLQRQRPVTDAGAVPGRRGGREGALLHRRRRLRRDAERRVVLVVGHRGLGGADLPGPDRRRRHRLRPHRHLDARGPRPPELESTRPGTAQACALS